MVVGTKQGAYELYEVHGTVGGGKGKIDPVLMRSNGTIDYVSVQRADGTLHIFCLSDTKVNAGDFFGLSFTYTER